MKILIISHYLNLSGAIDRFESYLIKHGNNVYKIAHNLNYSGGAPTIIYRNHKEKRRIKRISLGLFGVLNLIIDMIFSVVYIYRVSPKIVVGANNFDTFAGVFARAVLKRDIASVIYFASDFSESRFGGSFLDTIYIWVEKKVIIHSDLIISNTKRAEDKRLALGLEKNKSLVIPNGVRLSKEEFPNKKINKKKFVYEGSVTREHGLYELLKVMYPLISSFTIVGGGEDLERVIQLCEDLDINMTLHLNKSHEFMIDFLQEFDGIGLAPYNTESLWTYYASPLKVVEYISCGLPVLMSGVPEIAVKVRSRELGMTYTSLSIDEIERQINGFDTKDFNRKAKNFYEEYKLENLYSRIPI